MFAYKMSRAQRNRALQLALAVLFGLGLWAIANNVADNLRAQNLAFGFGFLSERAGFHISQSLIAFDEDNSYGRVLLVGLLNTLLVAFIGIILASLLGFLLGIARLSGNFLIRNIAAAYVEIFRNVPLLLHILFWYFGVLSNLPRPRMGLDLGGFGFLSNRGLVLPAPIIEAAAIYYLAAAVVLGLVAFALRRAPVKRFWRVFGLTALALFSFIALVVGAPFSVEMPILRGFNYRGGIMLIPELIALLLALSLYTAAFIAEIVRAGLLAVERGQSEAATALGLSWGQSLRFIIIPQALRVIVPPLTNQYLNLTKNSSLAVAIAYPDIVSVFAGTALSQIGQAIEIIFITMLIYLGLSLLTSFLMNRYNARIALTER